MVKKKKKHSKTSLSKNDFNKSNEISKWQKSPKTKNPGEADDTVGRWHSIVWLIWVGDATTKLKNLPKYY